MTGDSNNHDSTNRRSLQYLSRRGVLKTGAAFGLGGLAGCMGDEDSTPMADDGGQPTTGDGGDSTNTSTPGGEPVEERVDARLTVPFPPNSQPIPDLNWNAYNPTTYAHEQEAPGNLLCGNFALYHANVDEGTLVLGDDWSYDANSSILELTLRDDLTWHDGTQMTMEDHLVQMQLNEATTKIATPPEDRPDDWVWSEPIESYEQTGDFTMEYTLRVDGEVSDSYIYSLVMPEDYNVKRTIYKEWADELIQLVEDEDWGQAQERLTAFLEMRVDEPYGNGPFKYSDHDDTRFILEVNEDYPYADNILFSEFAFVELESRPQAFINGQVDALLAGLPLPPDLEGQSPEYHVVNGDHANFQQVIFNLGHFDSQFSDASEGAFNPASADRLVRKALLWAFDKPNMADAIGGHAKMVDGPPRKIAPIDVEEGTYDDWTEENNLEMYGPEANPDQARSYLEEAGYSFDENENSWFDEEGEPLEITILSPSSGADVFMSQVMADNLAEIGVDVTLEAKDGTTFSNQRFQGVFDMIPDGTSTGATRAAFPETSWFHSLCHGYPNDWRAPMPIGERNGEVQSINQERIGNQYLQQGNVEDLHTLMWAWNQYLPGAEQVYSPDTGGIRADKWYVEGERGVRHWEQAVFNLLHAPNGTIAPLKDSV